MTKSDKFVASNSAEIEISPAGSLSIDKVTLFPRDFSIRTTKALREFFLAERDEELGRWRWPESPEYVVYPKQASEVESEPGVRVVNEASGRSKDISRDVVGFCPTVTTRAGEAAQAYFAAHPVSKPWHDAKPGEVWVFKGKNLDPHPFTVHPETGNWINPAGYTLEDKYTTDRPYGYSHDPDFEPRRIWPEVADSSESH